LSTVTPANGSPSHPNGAWSHVVAAARHIFIAVHDSTGLTWALAIPLSNVLLKATMVGLTKAITYKSDLAHSNFQPFQSAYRSAFARVPAKPHVGQFSQSLQSIDGSEESKSQVVPNSKQLYPAMTLIHWRDSMYLRYTAGRSTKLRLLPKALRFLNLPVWLTLTEGLRAMSASPYGLPTLAARGLGFWKDDFNSLSGVRSTAFWGHEYVVSSLSSEGLPWCANLMLPDPTAALSFVLAVTVMYTLRNLPARLCQLPSLMVRPKLARVVRYVVPASGLVLVPLTSQVPAALLIYWITSAWTGSFLNALSAKIFPLPKAVHPLSTGTEFLAPPPTWLLPKDPRAAKQGKEK